MCRPVTRSPIGWTRSSGCHQKAALKLAAKRILRKYRKQEEKKEMEKLRRLLPSSNSQKKLRKREVIDQTIDLIMCLETQLMQKIQREGRVPGLLAGTGIRPGKIDLDSLRHAMAQILPSRQQPQVV